MTGLISVTAARVGVWLFSNRHEEGQTREKVTLPFPSGVLFLNRKCLKLQTQSLWRRWWFVSLISWSQICTKDVTLRLELTFFLMQLLLLLPGTKLFLFALNAFALRWQLCTCICVCVWCKVSPCDIKVPERHICSCVVIALNEPCNGGVWARDFAYRKHTRSHTCFEVHRLPSALLARRGGSKTISCGSLDVKTCRITPIEWRRRRNKSHDHNPVVCHLYTLSQ